DAKWHITTRAAGLSEATFGAQLAVSGIEGGVVTWPTIVGPLIGAGVATLGVDHAWAGAQTFVTGEHHDTLLKQAMHNGGVNQLAADAILFGADLAASAPMVVANGANNLLLRGVDASQLAMDGLHSAGNFVQRAVHGVALEAEHFLKPHPYPGRTGWSFFAKQNTLSQVAKKLPDFASDDLLMEHFGKHAREFKGYYNSPDKYLSGAHDVIRLGTKVAYEYDGEARVGYVRFMGTTTKKGEAKFEFVGTNISGDITTYHVKSGKEFWKTLNGDPRNKNIMPYDYLQLQIKPSNLFQY
ncbi:MAG: hypothetical protein ACYC0J_00365, partial [Gammaproteobacteria bacterium]